MRKWTDEKIYDWAKDTFGAHSPQAIAIRMNKEMAELLSAIENHKLKEACAELADLRVFMAQLNVILGAFANDHREIYERVDEKMDINQKREWEIAADGSHQHVEGT